MSSANVYKNKLDKGNTGEVWWKGLPILSVTKFEGKKTPAYEELPHPTIPGATIREEVGVTYTVSMDYYPTGDEDLEVDKLLGNDIVISNVGVNGRIISKRKYIGITWDEETLDAWERKTITKISMSGQAEHVIDL